MDCKERILSNDYYDIITDYPVFVETLDACSISVDNIFQLIYLNKDQIEDTRFYFYEHRTRPKVYGLMQQEDFFSRINRDFDPSNLIAAGILQVQRQPLALTGQGTILVFPDTGIDYRNPIFQKEDGSTRILAIWDQTIQTGEPPQGFLYGTLYTREQINEALASDNPYEIVPSTDTIGHGTDLAAVAAGSRLSGEESFLGAAPDADIVVIKLKECKEYLRDFYLLPREVPAYAETDLMEAIRFGETFAINFRRPVTYCIGVGTNLGDHAGNSAFSRYLNIVAARRSRAVVVCGGNEGNSAHHFKGNLLQSGASSYVNENVAVRDRVAGGGLNLEEGTDRGAVNVEVRVDRNAQGFLMELWGNVPDVFTISVRSPGGETIPPIRLGIRDVVNYSFIYEKTKIGISGELVEPVSGEELITIRMEAPTEGIWSFLVEAVGNPFNGEFHIWLPITQFMNADNFFLEPSPYVTLTEPAMAGNVLSVSTYNGISNSFYIDSGRGFTRTGGVKPDLAAPGVNIPVPRGVQTGASYAAALTAGAVAQFMQWAVVEQNSPLVESREVANYLARGADRNRELAYPNREWGYGTLDMVGTFDSMIGV